MGIFSKHISINGGLNKIANRSFLIHEIMVIYNRSLHNQWVCWPTKCSVKHIFHKYKKSFSTYNLAVTKYVVIGGL